MSLKNKLFIFAGEPSGDLHGANLSVALKKVMPSFHIEGIAGKHMRNVGVTGILTTEDFEVMGLSDVLMSLPRLYKQFYKTLNYLIKNPPAAIILIDYPGFNLRLAKHLRQKGYQGKIIQYISPSVWAHGKHRIEQMEKTLDLLLLIYPFEINFYKDTSLKVQYIGSPIKEKVTHYTYNDSWKTALQIPADRPLVGIFPGSRVNEIKRNLPLIIDAIKKFEVNEKDAIFCISCSINTRKETLESILIKYPEISSKVYIVPHEFTYELMKSSRVSIAKSGTVTLELSLHRCPTIVVYKTSKLDRFYAKYILKAVLQNYCIVNILSGKEIFPELIKEEFTSEKLFNLMDPLYKETSKRSACIVACDELFKTLGTNSPSLIAADAILEVLA